MSLISIHNLSIAFGGPAILDSISMDLHKGQRIGLLGRNGTGKSTFMKIIAGILNQDSGELIINSGSKIAYLPQNVPTDVHGTIYEIVVSGAGLIGEKLARLNLLSRNGTSSSEYHQLQEYINTHDGWKVQTIAQRVISQIGLQPETDFDTLSGGMRRRVFLARALVKEPDLLLLDEPTNHMDVDSINWLENFLLSENITVLFITHDRRLLKKLATRIIELDRGKLYDWACSYEIFLQRKKALLDAEEKEWERFDKKLAQEEVWIRRGVKARRTRNEGRVRALKKMRAQRLLRREQCGSVTMEISQAGRSGDKVLSAKAVFYLYNPKEVIRNFTTTILRGDRIGIIGPNGCGKTTLLNLMTGKLTPSQGSVELGTNIEISYFDQLRTMLDPEKTVWQNVAPNGADTVFINGSPKHVITYLQDFLFTSDRAKSPVKQLSGGELNRLLLARLFTQPSNVLIFDEPTNDLDTDTVELLEELLLDYSGTVLIVSHDREFLNNVVTSILSFEPDGTVKEYVGGYDDWEEQFRQSLKQTTTSKKTEVISTKKTAATDTTVRPKKLSFKERQTLEKLPLQIEIWEKEYEELTRQMADPKRCQDQNFLLKAKTNIPQLENQIAEGYRLWEQLAARDQ